MQRWTTVPVPYQRSDAESFVRELMPRGLAEPFGDQEVCDRGVPDGERPRFAGSIDFRQRRAGRRRGGLRTRTRAPRARPDDPGGPAGGDLGVRNAGGRGRPVAGGMSATGASRRVAWALRLPVRGRGAGHMVEARGQRSDAWVASLLRGDPMTAGPAWLEPVELTGGGVRLRPWRDGDEDRVVEAMQDGRIRRRLPRIPAPYTVRDARTFLLGERTRAAEGGGGRVVRGRHRPTTAVSARSTSSA